MKPTHEILSACLDSAIEFGREFKFDSTYLGHLCVVSLYMSMLELTAEILHLNREGPKPGIPIIARSILEAYVEIKNLTEDDEYIVVVEGAWVQSWLKMMKSAKDGNQYLSLLAQDSDLETNIEQHEAKLKELKENGYKWTTFKSKFKKAGLEEEYDTIYDWLSSYSHGSLRALIQRHIQLEEEENPKVNAFQDMPISEFETSLGTVTELIVRASDHVNSYLNVGADDAIERMRKVVNEHRSEITST